MHRFVTNWRRSTQRNERTFRASAHRARQVRVCSTRRAARKHEGLERRESDFVTVDGAFEALDVANVEPWLAARIAARSRRQFGAEIKELTLDTREERIDIVVVHVRSEDADAAVELVDLAVRVYPFVVLRHTRAPKESGLAFVARFCVDFHQRNVTESAAGSIARRSERSPTPQVLVTEALGTSVASQERRSGQTFLARWLKHAHR